jgi:hypothetical protein
MWGPQGLCPVFLLKVKALNENSMCSVVCATSDCRCHGVLTLLATRTHCPKRERLIDNTIVELY